jgi:hypothetical protein
MPLIRSQDSKDKAEQENRIFLAIQAIQKQHIGVRLAARTSNVPQSTLCARLSGVPYRATVRANSHKLTESEEETL